MTKLKAFTFDQCCEIVSGSTPKTSVSEYWDGEICWATPKDLSELQSHYISDTPRKITEAGLKSCASTILPTNSVLFSSRAPIGHVAVNTVPMATNQGFKSLIPNSELLDSKFLFHWLRANRAYLESLGNGATFKEISKATVARIEIFLPPLPEQRRIAAILDQTDALRAKRREALAQLDSLTQSIFIALFGDPNFNDKGWKVVSLNSICRAIWDIDHKMPKSVETGLPFISAKDLVQNGEISFDDVKMISSEDFNRLAKKGKPVQGDIIYSRIGVNLGKARLVTVDFPFLASYSCCTIRPDDSQVDRHFLCHLLDSPYLLKQAHKGVRAIAVPDLGMGEIKNFQIILPPLDYQRNFSERLVLINKIRSDALESLSHFDSLFASLQHRAFRGEL